MILSDEREKRDFFLFSHLIDNKVNVLRIEGWRCFWYYFLFGKTCELKMFYLSLQCKSGKVP